MTEPTDRPEPATQEAAEPDPDVLELAAKIFNLARDGEAGTLAAYVDAGVPVDLSNDKGDTLVMLAAYHGHSLAGAALLAPGGDPAPGNDRGRTPLAGGASLR